MENWYLTGEEGLSFPDIQNFLSWIDPNDHVIDIEIHSCGGDAVEGYPFMTPYVLQESKSAVLQ